MEYIYGVMLLHVAGQEVSEANLKSVLKAAGLKPDDARVKALTASLEGVDIEEAIQGAVSAPVAPGPAPAEEKKPKEKKPEKKEKKKEEEEVTEEEAAAGLGALFGM